MLLLPSHCKMHSPRPVVEQAEVERGECGCVKTSFASIPMMSFAGPTCSPHWARMCWVSGMVAWCGMCPARQCSLVPPRRHSVVLSPARNPCEFLCPPNCFLCATPTPLHSVACLLATMLQWSLSLCSVPGLRIISWRNTTATFFSCPSPCSPSRVSSAFSAVNPPTFHVSISNSRLQISPLCSTASRCFGV